MTRDPFSLSALYAIDPAYSTTTCRPPKTGLSLWSTKHTGPLWLYTPGNLEAWLFDRSRREAFSTCMNIYHPGRYRETSHPDILFNQSFAPATQGGRGQNP